MKRTPLRRHTPLRRTSAPMRQAPIRARNPERAKRRRATQFGTDGKREWIINQRCAICGALPPSEPAHAKSRGAGGTAADLLPMCHRCHREQHDVGVLTFGRYWGVDLRELAREYEREWRGRAA